MTEQEQSDITKLLEELNKTNSRILELLDFLVHDEIEKSLSHLFTSSKEMRVYELTDGTRSTRDIGQLIGLDKQGISILWRKWAEIGIVESTGARKPYKTKYSVFELTKMDFDLENQ